MESLPVDILIEIFKNIIDDEQTKAMDPQFVKHIQLSFIKLVSKQLRHGALAYIDRHLPKKFSNAQSEEILIHLAKNNYLSCLMEAQNRYDYHANLGTICAKAASKGHIAIVKYLLDQGCLLLGYIIQAASKSGSLGMIQLVKEHCGKTWIKMFGVNFVPLIERGHIAIVDYLVHAGLPLDSYYDFPAHAALGGQLDMLKYLHAHNCSLDYATTLYAAKGGSLECLKYAHENGGRWSEDTVDAAAEGHLDVLQYLVEHGCSISPEACSRAAYYDHLPCLQYLHEHGAAWGPFYQPDMTTFIAAQQGSLECLKYAHEHGAQWTDEACAIAVANKHEHILKYLHENNCPCPHRL